MPDRLSDTEFAEIRKQLVFSAIDAYMVTVEPDAYSSDRFKGYYYIGRDRWCEKPNEHAEGGGEVLLLVDEALQDCGLAGYSSEFEQVRFEIYRLLSSWIHLPDPRDIQPILTTVNRVFAELSPNGTAVAAGGVNITGPGAAASGPIDGKRRRMETVLPLAFAGMAMGALGRYLDDLQQKTDNISYATLLLTLNLATEHAIWSGAQADVVALMKDCTAKFDAVAARSVPSWDWKVALNLLTCIAEAACWFIPAVSVVARGSIGALSAIEVAENAGASALRMNDLAVQTRVSSGAGLDTYYRVRDQLADNLRELNAEIKNQENDIRNQAKLMLDDMLANETYYRFDPADVAWDSGEFGDPSEISHNAYQAGSLSGIMKEISNILHIDARALNLHGGMIRFYIRRRAEIGIASGYGPSAILEELNGAISDLLEEISIEYDQGSRNVIAASNYLDAAESGSEARLLQARSELDSVAREIEEGSGIDPLSFQDAGWYQKMPDSYPTDLRG